MNLAGKAFRAVTNSANGSLNSDTVMHFTRDEEIVAGHYGGGTIRLGQLLARRVGGAELEMLYQGATTAGAIQSGKARALFTVADGGRMRMSLEWQWLTGDQSAGRSEWVEMA